MASGPIISWQIDGETTETVAEYIFWFQNHCRWWLQPGNRKTLTPWKESYDQPIQHIKNQRDYFANKDYFVRLVKAVVFPVVMYGCESWTINKAEQQRTDAFELWCWRRLFGVPWTARRSNQSILKRSVLGVHWKDWCCSWNSSTFTTWCEELTHLKRPWCWERLRAGGEEDNRGWDGWMASPTQWIWVWVDSGSWRWTGRPGVHEVTKHQTWLSERTELNMSLFICLNPQNV